MNTNVVNPSAAQETTNNKNMVAKRANSEVITPVNDIVNNGKDVAVAGAKN